MDPSKEQTQKIVCPPTQVGETSKVEPTSRVVRDPGEDVGVGRPYSGEDPEISDWVRKAQEGNEQAFERLIRHFQDRVWRRALYRLKDHEEAYDVAQEVFLICFRKLTQFRGESKFWTWLCRIVDTQVINRQGWLQRRGKGRTVSLDQARDPEDRNGLRAWDPPDPAAGPRREVENSQSMEALERNLNLLSLDHREILLLRFADGLSYEEIADTLDLTLGTVKSRINRARTELRILMSDYLE